MAQLVGRNEGVEYIKGMVRQSKSDGMEYPRDTNMIGGAKAGSAREHHAEGDMVGNAGRKAFGGARPGAMFRKAQPSPVVGD